MEKRKNCYIYIRVSTAAQIDGYSLDAQKERLEEYADYKELNVAGLYCDAGRSGHDIKGRPEFRRMLDDIASEKDEVSYILVFKLSRFGRNAADVLRSLQLIQDYGADLVSVEEGIDSSTQGGKLMLSLLSAVAEIERENISVQFLSGRIQKIREGGWGGGAAPYGYRLTEDGLEPDPEEAAIVQKIFESFLEEGKGYSTVTRELNDAGCTRPSPKGEKPFDAGFVKNVIRNPVHAGFVTFGRRSETREAIYAAGKHKALISVSTWEKAQEKADKLRERSLGKEKTSRAHLLSGLIRCPVCGRGLVGTTGMKLNRNHGGRYADMHYYICRYHRKADGESCSFNRRIKEEKADEAVREAVGQVLATPDFRKAVEERYGTHADGQDREDTLKKARKRLKSLREEQKALEDTQDTLDILSDDYDDRYEELQDRIDGIYDRIDEAEEKIRRISEEGEDDARRKVQLDQIEGFLRNFDGIYEKMTPEEKKEYFRTFIAKVEIFEKPEDGRIIKSIEFRIPVGEKDGTFTFTLDCTKLPKSKAESKATYAQVKSFVEGKYGVKVSTLYISQIKRLAGLDVSDSYNRSKKEKHKVPKCPPQKAAYILDALKHFRMVPEDAELKEDQNGEKD